MGFNLFNNIFKNQNEHAENECMKILGMLDSILDEEATAEQRLAFQDHLEKCMPCYERYDLDKSVKELLRNKCNMCIPEGLVESIKVQVAKADSY